MTLNKLAYVSKVSFVLLIIIYLLIGYSYLISLLFETVKDKTWLHFLPF